jgi:hypothetical protein
MIRNDLKGFVTVGYIHFLDHNLGILFNCYYNPKMPYDLISLN